MLISFTVLFSITFDALIGEPRRWHPLVGFGNIANHIEKKLNNHSLISIKDLRIRGLVAWMLMVIPLVFASAFIVYIPEYFNFSEQSEFKLFYEFVLAVVFLGSAIAIKSLTEHANAVAEALFENNAELARKRVSMMVSRDTTKSDVTEINKATIESVLENGNDAIFAAIFWFVILGVPGVVLYRLSNTLDAMWGYRNERYVSFGWAAARIDDILNWIPARLTAISYSLAGNTGLALRCWLTQAKAWNGINPGTVMAAGAGALKIKLGGKAFYHGDEVNRPELGVANEPDSKDIGRANTLIRRSIIIWILFIFILELVSVLIQSGR